MISQAIAARLLHHNRRPRYAHDRLVSFLENVIRDMRGDPTG